jgi:CMP-N,N'-diacetyllegionaminic acid synthase
MINDKSVIAIIPARAGSKGLPGKNLKPLNGIPLILWSINQALSSRLVDLVLVSTDSSKIASISLEAGAEAPFIRPQHLATDEASTIDVIIHSLQYYSSQGRLFDYVVLMEPTSPLRKYDDIDNMITMLDSNAQDYDSIVSLGEVHENPYICKSLQGGAVVDFIQSRISNRRRQDYGPIYFPYGVGYIAKTNELLNQQTFYTNRCLGYIIDRCQNYEIDDICDFLCVESIVSAFPDFK